MIVTFSPSASDFNYSENQNINLVISWIPELTTEELEEPVVNSIVSKTITITPESTNINIVENTGNFTLSGSFSLDDFDASIFYVDNGSSDKIQSPVNVSKYSLVPNNKDVYKIIPIETSKTFALNVNLKDKNDVIYNKIYNINIKINNTTISNWTKNYFEERY